MRHVIAYLVPVLLIPGATFAERAADDFGGRDRKAILQLLDEDLREGDLPVRLETAWKLARLGGADALQVLARGLDSRLGVVRAEVVEALGSMKQPATVPYLSRALTDPHHWVRSAAAAVLAQQGDKSVVPALEKLHVDEQFLVRRNAALSVLTLEGASAVPGLLEMLGDDDWRVRALITCDLTERRVAAARPALRRLLNDDNWRVQVVAAHAIGALQDTGGVQGLTQLARSENPWVARTAVAALHRLGIRDRVTEYVDDANERLSHLQDAETRTKFLAGLEGCTAWVRRQAALGLGVDSDRSMLPALIARLDSRHASDQLDAARRIGTLGDKAGTHALLNSLRSKREWVRLESMAGLAKLGRPHLHTPLLKLLEEEVSWPVRQKAVALLGQLQQRGTEDAVRGFLGDTDLWVRLAAVDSLAQFKDAGAPGDVRVALEAADALEAQVPDELRRAAASGRYVRDDLRERVKTTKGADQRAAALALRWAADRCGCEAAAEQLASADLGERLAAAAALERIGEPASVPAILQQMDQEQDLWTFHALRAALLTMADKAVPSLVTALNDEDEAVRTIAHLTIQEITKTKVSFNAKQKNPKPREAQIQRFLKWWSDYHLIRSLGYGSIKHFQKLNAVAVTGLIDHWTKLKLQEIRERQARKQ